MLHSVEYTILVFKVNFYEHFLTCSNCSLIKSIPGEYLKLIFLKIKPYIKILLFQLFFDLFFHVESLPSQL